MPFKQTPQAAVFTHDLQAFMTRRALDQDNLAGLMAVPVNTIKKWTSGVRNPNASAVRLLEVFVILEVMAPDFLDALLPACAALPVSTEDTD